jgi:hypothetical protein
MESLNGVDVYVDLCYSSMFFLKSTYPKGLVSDKPVRHAPRSRKSLIDQYLPQISSYTKNLLTSKKYKLMSFEKTCHNGLIRFWGNGVVCPSTDT